MNKKVDSYGVNGDDPNIESVFFIELGKVKHVIVLVSWKQLHRAEGINGYLYHVYGYAFDGENLTINKDMENDTVLDGVEGEFNGDALYFKYKTAATIRIYLQARYGR